MFNIRVLQKHPFIPSTLMTFLMRGLCLGIFFCSEIAVAGVLTKEDLENIDDSVLLDGEKYNDSVLLGDSEEIKPKQQDQDIEEEGFPSLSELFGWSAEVLNKNYNYDNSDIYENEAVINEYSPETLDQSI